ncbi:MAG: hypothetical protein SVJ22_08070 [Halobacteriota archaeon]|nr:hypothetical protein [Halobacteriota archaeon]
MANDIQLLKNQPGKTRNLYLKILKVLQKSINGENFTNILKLANVSTGGLTTGLQGLISMELVEHMGDNRYHITESGMNFFNVWYSIDNEMVPDTELMSVPLRTSVSETIHKSQKNIQTIRGRPYSVTSGAIITYTEMPEENTQNTINEWITNDFLYMISNSLQNQPIPFDKIILALVIEKIDDGTQKKR